MKNDSENKIINYFTRFAKKDKIPGFAATVILRGQTHQFTDGNLSLINNNPVNNDTLFEIGSLSKPITAAIIREMEKKGMIDREKSLYDYLGSHFDINPIFKHLLIKDVLVHRAGLPRIPRAFFEKMKGHQDPYAVIGREEINQYLHSPEELNKPGKFKYSNLGYALLAEIICIIMQSGFDEAAKNLLFAPLGMNRSGTLPVVAGDENIAVGHSFKNKEEPYWTGRMLDGAGSILSTNNDMTRFLEFARTIPEPTSWSWQIKNGFFSKLLRYNGFIWHNGMTGGFGSYMAFHPEKDAAMFMVANKASLLDTCFYYFSSHIH